MKRFRIAMIIANPRDQVVRLNRPIPAIIPGRENTIIAAGRNTASKYRAKNTANPILLRLRAM